MNKTHKNCIEFHKNQLEEKYNYKCRRELDLARQGNIHKLDLGCFEKIKPPIAMEVESTKNFQNPQVKSNAEDLKEFKRIYPNAKTYHITTDQVIDFDKELNFKSRFKPIIGKP